MSNFDRDRRVRLSAVFILLISILTILIAFESLALSAVLAVIIHYLLAPTVNALERQGVDRRFAIAIPFVVCMLLLVVGGQLLVPVISEQIESFRDEFPNYIEESMGLVSQFENKLEGVISSDNGVEFKQKLRDSLFVWTQTFAEDLPSILSSSLTTLLLAPFFAFFLLLDGRRLMRSFLKLVPNAYFELFLNLSHQINRQIGDFFRARILEAVIVGLVVAIGLLLIGFPYAALLSIFAGVTNLIPYVGPVIGAVPAVIIAVINQTSGFDFTLLVLVYMTAHIIDAVFIIPIVVAKIVNLHPVLVILGIIIGAQTMGVVGMIISIPLASALKVTISAVYSHLTEFRV